jgi:emfourin
MHIDFKRSGGFANLRLTYQGDSNELPQNVAEEFSRLVESSGFFDIKQTDLDSNSTRYPDVFNYQVSLSDSKRQHSLSCNDVTAPDSLRPLLSFLQKLALHQI